MRFSLLLFVVLFGLNTVVAQNPIRQFVGIELTDAGAEIQVSDGKYLIAPLSGKIIQTIFIPTSSPSTRNESQFQIDTSHAVMLKPSKDLLWTLDRVVQENGMHRLTH